MGFDPTMTVQAILRTALLDELTCEICMMLDGIMLRADDPRWNGEIGGPSHPHCRCMFVPILDTGTLVPTLDVDVPDVFKHGVAVRLIDDWEDMPMAVKGADKLKASEIIVDDIMLMLEPYEVYAGLLLGEG